LVAIAGSMFLLTHSAVADMPSMVRQFKKQDFVFGSIKITQSFDSRKDPMGPEFKLRMWDKGRLLLSLNDVAFDKIYPSPDREVFVGLSNSGWPGSAVIVFDRRGRIWLVANHGMSEFEYCAETSTMLKEWYDGRDPAIRFAERSLAADDLLAISLKNCKGERVQLWDVIATATEKANLLRHQAGR
jgi:hypothetical protein